MLAPSSSRETRRGKFLSEHGFAHASRNVPTYVVLRVAGMTTTVATDIIAVQLLYPLDMIDSRLRRFLTVLFPALLLPLQLLLFGPFTIYSSNAAEFSAPFWSLAVHLAPMDCCHRRDARAHRVRCRQSSSRTMSFCWWRWA